MPPKKKYSREGVEAAVRLATETDEAIWTLVETKYDEMIAAKGGSELVKLDQFCQEKLISMKTAPEKTTISKSDLLKIVDWKFRVGKPRHALMKHLRVNTDQQVKTHAKAGFELADEGRAKEAILEVSKLRGVGPATSSAILCLYNPNMFVFMADEVIECLYPGKRGYTAAIYHSVNDKCIELAETLGDKWNARRVGRALWTAARISAEGGEDVMVLHHKNQRVTTVDGVEESTEKKRPRKRRKVVA